MLGTAGIFHSVMVRKVSQQTFISELDSHSVPQTN